MGIPKYCRGLKNLKIILTTKKFPFHRGKILKINTKLFDVDMF